MKKLIGLGVFLSFLFCFSPWFGFDLHEAPACWGASALPLLAPGFAYYLSGERNAARQKALAALALLYIPAVLAVVFFTWTRPMNIAAVSTAEISAVASHFGFWACCACSAATAILYACALIRGKKMTASAFAQNAHGALGLRGKFLPF